ncbi:M23 family metallopeptidase [Sphingomonas glaciei]|uniref:M23 family metallopeptidase n=1 Tax=Sphingomonas glaciei TaxID=2938948 RepID=A0ABY5MU39_9SPHN|nr:M23 family metallopeptidase [Sphingomonas glaciei]UUR07718.1 M23 family metallopeptidase [Sphingomonas glaciei]
MTHAIRTTGLLRSRDLFVHDGSKLRRIRLSATTQFAFFIAAALMLAWSAFAAAHFLGGDKAAVVSGDTAQLQQLAVATEQRARLIEQRQKVLATMLAGGDVDPSALPETSDASSLPAAIAAPLARAETRLAAEEAAAAERLEQRYRTATRELKKLGLSPKRLAVGGPFEPATKSDPTFRALFNSWKKLDSLQDGVIAVPSDKPVKTAEFTSSFGVRNDPFGRGAAMHAGIDLAGPHGTPIYATADGTVTDAGFNSGGYGNLVKLDHGRGIETRYGHLAAFSVRAGDRVKRGQLIGRMGSTGRSTGSHLHYEVRIDGRAVNPIPFMRSTDYLASIKSRNGHSMDQIALGGPGRSKR